MNRTLLLIICDFLLLNLLALTRWDKADPLGQRTPPDPSAAVGVAAGAKEDLVATLRDALAEERGQRDAFRNQVANESSARNASMAQLAEQRRQLESELTQARQSASQLDQQLAERSRLATETREQLDQAQARLQETTRNRDALSESVRTAEAERKKLQQELEEQRRQTATLANARAEAEKQAAKLASDVKVAEAERNLLRENVNDLKGQVNRVQEEKAKLQEQTTTLTQGITRLAKNSDEFKQEYRDNIPINANLLFSAFLSNRVSVVLSGIGAGIFGTSQKTKESSTVLVSDGTNTVALVHVDETPFSLSVPGFGLEQLTARVTRDTQAIPTGRPFLSDADPRIVGVPVDATKAVGFKVFPLSRTPFKFPEAVLVSRGGRYYGEVEFKLDPRIPDFVRMKTRLVSRVFGEFSPSAGDLVLSKTGEILGIMVNSEYCAVLKDLLPAPGGVLESGLSREEMGRKLEASRMKVNSLPASLQ